MLTPQPDRVLYGSCWHENECITAINRNIKLLHHFNKKPDEAYNMQTDPDETKNIINTVVERQKKLEEALSWYRNMMAYYGNYKRTRGKK